MAHAGDLAVIGHRGTVRVPRLGLGTGPLGNLYTPVSDHVAASTLETAWESGIRYFDTAPLYGLGLAEIRLGRFVGGVPRSDVVVATKVGRRLVNGVPPPGRRVPGWERDLWLDTPAGVEPLEDYRADAVRASLDESLRRLELDRVDIVNVHVPDRHVVEALSGALPALARLREEGVVGAIGVGTADLAVLERFVRESDLDCILLAGSWTVLDGSAADRLLPLCLDRAVSVLMGSVLAGGLLVDAPADGSAPPGADRQSDRIEQVRSACRRAGVSLIAGALQFPLRHPAVASVLVGARTPDEVRQDVAAFGEEIPAGFWATLAAQRSAG